MSIYRRIPGGKMISLREDMRDVAREIKTLEAPESCKVCPATGPDEMGWDCFTALNGLYIKILSLHSLEKPGFFSNDSGLKERVMKISSITPGTEDLTSAKLSVYNDTSFVIRNAGKYMESYHCPYRERFNVRLRRMCEKLPLDRMS